MISFDTVKKSFSHLILASVLSLSAAATAQQPTPGAATKQLTQARQLFMENRGQWDPQAQFLSQTPGLDYWVTRDGVVLDTYRIVPGQDGPVREGQVVRMRFEGASSRPTPLGVGVQNGFYDFYVGDPSKHARGVRIYEEATQQSMLRGVDVRTYMGENGRPRYDLNLAAGIDPNTIQMRFDGAKAIKVDSRGDLVIDTQVGALRQRGLFVYQLVDGLKKQVPASFKLNGADRVSFSVGAYDRTKPLVIDPLTYPVVFGSHFGGDAGPDICRDVVTDNRYNVYLTGQTGASQFPITNGFYGNVSLQGTTDAFVAELDRDNFTIRYAAFVGGSGVDIGYAIALSPTQDQLYVAGTTTSTNFPGVNANSFRNTRQGTTDVFITRLTRDPLGGLSPTESTYYGAATRALTIVGMEVAPNGNVVIAGTTTGSGLPNTANSAFGGNDAYVTYFNSTVRAISYSQYIGGVGSDIAGGLAVDLNSNVVVGGTVEFVGNQDTSVIDPPRFETSSGVYRLGRLLRNNDAFVFKLDANGMRVFSTLIGGSGNDSNPPALGDAIQIAPVYGSQTRVAVDVVGDIYVSSIARSSNYPRTQNTFGVNFTQFPTVALTKLTTDGSEILYGTSLRTNGRVYANGIGVDTAGIVTVAGIVSFDLPFLPGPTIPGSIITTPDAIDGVYLAEGSRQYPPPMGAPPSSTDGFVMVMNADASQQIYSSYIGLDGSSDEALNVFVDSLSGIWLVGSTADVNPPAGQGGLNPGYVSDDAPKRFNDPGAADGWLIKLRVQQPSISSLVVTPTSLAGGLGASATATLTLTRPAGVGGINVVANIEGTAGSFDPNSNVSQIIVTIPELQSSVQFQVYTRPVVNPDQFIVRVTLASDTKYQVVTVSPWLDKVTFSPLSVVGGNTAQGRIRLFQPAIVPITVTLISDRPDLIDLPATIVIEAGQQVVDFLVPTRGVSTPTQIRITAQIANIVGPARVAILNLLPAVLETFTLNPARVNGGTTTVATITLNGQAGANTVVNISQVSGPSASFPSQVTIPQGQRSVSFDVTPPYVTTNTSIVLRATKGTEILDAELLVDTISMTEMTLTVNGQVVTSVQGGTVVDGTVRLNKPAAPGGANVMLFTTKPDVATVTPSILNIPQGQVIGTFKVNTKVLTGTQNVDVIAALGYTQAITKTLEVRQLSLTLSLDPQTVTGYANSTGTVTLNAPAPPGGLVVNLTSSNTAVATVPAQVTIPAGQASAQFTISTNSVSDDTDVTITASIGSIQTQAVLRVTPPYLQSLVISPNNIRSGESATATLSLDLPAGPNGVVVTLSAEVGGSPSNLVSQPASVTIPAGQRSVQWTIVAKSVSRQIAVDIVAQVGTRTRISALLNIRP